MTDLHQELRWHPLLEQWVVISANTAVRPVSGRASTNTYDTEGVAHDADCYLCPGVKRASGNINPVYEGHWSFDNDFPSLQNAESPDKNNETPPTSIDVLMRSAAASGQCRVLCWTEKHNMTLAELSTDEMLGVVKLWRDEYNTVSQKKGIKHILIFENKGLETGVSNLHPHGQLYATGFLTDTAIRMRSSQSNYWKSHNKPLLQALINRKEYKHNLLIEEGSYFKTIVPYFARFAYETWIVPKRHVSTIDQLSDEEIEELAKVYQNQAKRYDVLFNRKSPNITILHNAPCDEHLQNQNWCFYIAMQPPLRDPENLKYLAGFESGSNNIVNPLQPEVAANDLRSCSTQIGGTV